MELAEFKKLMKQRDFRESLKTFRGIPYGEQCRLVAEAGDAVRDWVERIGADPWLRFWLGPFVRSTVLPKPHADAYGLGLLQDELFSPYGKDNRDAQLSSVLRKHADVLEDDLWRLFRLGGVRDFSLAGQDSNGAWSWAEAIRELAAAGDIDRGRVLDASLEALARGFTKFQAGWFSRLHESLAPTLDEKDQRSSLYMQLLAVDVEPTVTLAIDALSELSKANRLNGTDFLKVAPQAILGRGKGNVKKVIAILERIVATDPSSAADAGFAAACGLEHTAADVQEIALKFIAAKASPLSAALRARLQGVRDVVAASVKGPLVDMLERTSGAPDKSAQSVDGKQVAKTASPPSSNSASELRALAEQVVKLDDRWRRLAGVDQALAAIERGDFDFGAPLFTGSDIPRLDDAARIEPIASLDELIDAISSLSVERTTGLEMERILDGLLRLGLERPADFAARTAPLAKQLEKFQMRWFPSRHYLPPQDLKNLATWWIQPDKLYQSFRRSVEGCYFASFTERVHVVQRRLAAGKAMLLLALPTHRGGWIAADVLVERAKQRQSLDGSLDRFDAVQALLRLAPEGRQRALAQAEQLPGQFGAALRFALGSDHETIGESPELWLAAALSRSAAELPTEVAKKFADLGPAAQPTSGYEWGKVVREHRNRNLGGTMNPPFETVDVLRLPRMAMDAPVEYIWAATYHREPNPDAPLSYLAVELQWAALAWPSSLSPYFASAVAEVGEDLIDGKVESYVAFFEPLFDPDVPLDEMAALLVLLGLTAANKAVQGVAVDALVAMIDDGRVDLCRLTEVLRRLLASGVVKMNRLSGNLKRVAEVSALHRYVVATVVQDAVASAAEHVSAKELHYVFELVHESLVAVGHGVANAVFRQLLQSQTSGKAGKLAKAMLALANPTDMNTSTSVVLPLLKSRLVRAQRWMARSGEE